MKKMLLLLGLVITMTGANISLVTAREGVGTNGSRNINREQSRGFWRQKGNVLGIKDWKVTAENCSNVQTRIMSKSKSIQVATTKKAEKYNKIITKIGLVTSRADEEELDTSVLKSKVQELIGKIDAFKLSAAELDAKFSQVAAVNCTADVGPTQLRVLLQESREKLKEVKVNAENVHAYIKGDIVAVLGELKSQLVDGQNKDE